MTDMDRFLKRVDRSGGPEACHPWIGRKRNAKGYGAFYVSGRAEVAHRWLLGHLRGSALVWPQEIGCHRCDNPPCCNPAHLYVGSHGENTRDAIERSGHPAAARRARTHCDEGHELTEENTLRSGGRRLCRACHRARSRETARRQRARRGVKIRTRQPDGRFSWVEPQGVPA